MLVSYDVLTAFGVSALLSFVVFTVLLLMLAAISGLLQAKKSRVKATITKQIVTEKLLQNRTMVVPTAPEPTPPFARRLLVPQ